MTRTPDERIDRAIEWDRRASAAHLDGAYRRAERWSRAAHRLMVAEVGAAHPDAVHLANTLSRIVEVRGDMHEAESLARASVAAMNAIDVDMEAVHRIRIASHARLGDVLRALGQYAEAERILRHALEDATARLGDADQQTATVLNELAIVLKYTGGFDEAAMLYARALALALADDPQDVRTIATLYHNIGGLAHSRGAFAEGEEPARRAYELRRDLLGENHPDVAADAAAWAGLLEGLGRYGEARAIYTRALDIYRVVYGEPHPEVAYALSALASAEAGAGLTADAEQHYLAAAAMREQLFGAEHTDVALTLYNYARLLTDLGRRDEARGPATRARAVFTTLFQEGHPKRRAVESLMAELDR